MEVRSNRIGDIRSFYRRRLSSLYDDREADTLLFMVLTEYTGMTRAELLINLNQNVSESELLKIHFAVKELIRGKPIQYVLGFANFYGLRFIVNSKVLIPRPETEELVERVIKDAALPINPRILDLGTGSGCMAICLKKNIPGSVVTGIDHSTFALEVARENAALNEVKVEFITCDMLDRKDWSELHRFDIIVSNPSYVRNKDKKEMKKNVIDYEPPHALFVPDEDPLIYYNALADISKAKLNPSGSLYCEINQYLGSETEQVFKKKGFSDVQLFSDLNNNPRVIHCIR